uniref:PIN domain-containing protein n=2 Tax=Photinus pyralis TaxID=7054 RepID=A0A1Y1L3P3_PHOPY
MNRGRPHQQIYKPGSGPLRKTGQHLEDTESDTSFAHSRPHYSKDSHYRYKHKNDRNNIEIEALDYKIGDLDIKDDSRRRTKKPDQTFYVPKPVAQARETPSINRSNDNLSHIDNKSVANNNGSESDPRSKRYSNRRRPSDVIDLQENWRSNSPSRRDVRQGSEPRAYQPNNWNRGVRDTRSVDPSGGGPPPRNYGGGHMYTKPPSGRRHSSVGLEQEKRQQKNLDSLPPRFKKKYLEENKLDVNYIGTHSEGTWDGNSLVFQGSNQHHSNQQSQQGYPMKPPTSLPHSNMHMEPPYHNQHMSDNYNSSYYTLPRRGRGRSRIPQDYEYSVGGSYRSVTPDRVQRGSPTNSRPTTPLMYQHKTRSNENLYRGGNRFESSNRMPRNRGNFTHNTAGRRDTRREDYPKNQTEQSAPTHKFHEEPQCMSAPSPSPPPAATEPTPPPIATVPDNNRILDWSEEVELQVQLDAEEAFSDVVTRSSSMASLVEPNTVSQPSSSRRKNKRSSSRFREHSNDNQFANKYASQRNKDDHNNYYNNGEKASESRFRRRKTSRDKNASRESSFERGDSSRTQHENWREDTIRNKHNTERDEAKDIEMKKGGIIVLPTKDPERPKSINVECPRYPDIKKTNSGQQKSLFDPSNPSKPIIVKSSSVRISAPGFSESSENSPPQLHQYVTDQFGNVGPTWYDENSEGWRICHSVPLLKSIKQADYELQLINNSGLILRSWETVIGLRRFLMDSLNYLLCKDMKFCQSENVEQHFWRILYHNIIEMMRQAITNDPSNKKQYKEFVLSLIDEGTKYFESLVELLEQTYKFKVSDHLGYNSLTPQKGLGLVGLALISTQKIFIFLGDLVRYREQVNETSNYGKCRQWYIKAHEINPKNGRPYNQLAVLAVYARRKLDAVYYYMRSLMSSNPVSSAREYLNSLFDENARKYEQGERKRREERAEKARQHMKEKESETVGLPGSLRREIWIRPDGGRRVHRTTSAAQEPKHVDSEEEDLAALPCPEVNKRFVTSYLHVHGKLITKIGMETFQEAALQMLKEFRALLQHSPMPLNCNRFLQLLALNMFAIDSTQLKDPQLKFSSGYRSELQERALIISLQMFNLILERSISLLNEHSKLFPDSLEKLTMNSVSQDFHMLLPALKIWCDWMLCHSIVWNPPPSTQDYKIGPAGDVWTRLASIMNILEKFDKSIATSFVSEPREGYELIRLPEDAVLCGFTPLMYNDHSPTYAPQDIEPEIAQFALRLSKVHFFGTVFLYGLEEPVIKLEIYNGVREYISVVSTSANKDSPPSPVELIDDDDLLVESFSEDEGVEDDISSSHENTSAEIQYLLNRKVELEKRQRTQELHRQRVQKILQQSVVSVHIEIRPKILVPDTNCFIDYIAKIKTIVDAHVYTLMVPLVVLNELEGLARGGKGPAPSTRPTTDSQHVLKVAESAKRALDYLGNRHNNIKCVTTKGTTLATFTFTVEEDSPSDSSLRNDDKILATCLMLCKNNKDQIMEGEPRKLFREVVLLTEDRNLRVKALARDLPVRELPDFLQWAGLG